MKLTISFYIQQKRWVFWCLLGWISGRVCENHQSKHGFALHLAKTFSWIAATLYSNNGWFYKGNTDNHTLADKKIYIEASLLSGVRFMASSASCFGRAH
ncbi:hypothetical protein BZA70DRAFT_274076 [Myxozyma melibiosi]|uniref:Secreted protein n=1 Tax=Myxozyma melibiosi TaxID=54550 RepID=A0ABR1FFD3_9ASCO